MQHRLDNSSMASRAEIIKSICNEIFRTFVRFSAVEHVSFQIFSCSQPEWRRSLLAPPTSHHMQVAAVCVCVCAVNRRRCINMSIDSKSLASTSQIPNTQDISSEEDTPECTRQDVVAR
jgi:hypothetical protein